MQSLPEGDTLGHGRFMRHRTKTGDVLVRPCRSPSGFGPRCKRRAVWPKRANIWHGAAYEGAVTTRPGRRRDLPVLFPSYGERDESYRCGKGMGDGKDSRSRCPDELFVSARVVCSCLSTSASALIGAMCSFSAYDEVMFSTGAVWDLFISRQYKSLAVGKPRPCCRHLTES